jgi:hypothetical protein
MTATAGKMDIKELRNQLCNALSALERFEQEIFQPACDVTVRQAVTKLSVLPSFNIEMSLWVHRRSEFDLKWKVWDGNHHHEGSTLTAAVNAALDANRPAADPLAECDSALAATSL